MKCTTSFAIAMAALFSRISATATPQFYTLHVTQPASTQNLSVALIHSGAGLVDAALVNDSTPDTKFYFENGRLFSAAGGNLPPFGIDVSDVGDGSGFFSVVSGRLGAQGRDDWILGANELLTIPLQAAPNSWLQCVVPVEGGLQNSLAWGNAFANGSLPDGCSSRVQLYVTCV